MSGQDELDFAQLTVVCADPDQARQYVEATHAHEAWGDGMSIEEFQAIVDREMVEGGWAQNHGDLTWVLVRRSDPLRRILAGCETHRTKALVKRRGNDVVETFAYGITNVTTPAALRRKGYARHLLRCLHYILAGPTLPPFPEQWGEPPTLDATTRQYVPYGSFSYLSSDVGQTYYASSTIGLDLPGYVINPEAQNQLTWRIQPTQETSKPDGWQILYDDDFARIKPILSAGLKSKLAAETHSAFVVDPMSPGILEMVPQRGQMSSRKPWLIESQREPRGVQRGDAIVMLARDNYQIANDTLLITFTHNLSPEDLPSLLPVLDGLASEVGLTRGWVWGLDPSSALVKAWQDIEGRDAEASLRQGKDEHLYGVARYEDQDGQLIDQQMWIWL